MSTYRVAHIHKDGQDMIIIPLDSAFDLSGENQKRAELDRLQGCATAAGLRGAVVLVWQSASGAWNFIAPTPWHPFFRSITMAFVTAHLNRTLPCP